MTRTTLCFWLLLFAGCGNVDSSHSSKNGAEMVVEAVPETVAFDVYEGVEFTESAPDALGRSRSTDQIPVAAETKPATAGRKIIYNAEVHTVVSRLEEFLSQLRELVVEQGGFIGSSQEQGMDGSNPSATVVVRVPSAGYQPILIKLDELGTVERRSETSRDVTAEFVDIAARIRNKQQEEERLLELLAEAEGKLKEILEVERELSRVRGEIERAQGQMNVLKDQIDLATITVHASERTVYTPPTQAIFGDRVSAAWGNSLTNLGEFFSRASVAVVAFVPWLVIWIPGLAAAWFVARAINRRIKRTIA